MIAAVPFFPLPGEVLAERPELARPVLAAMASLRGGLFSEAYLAAADTALLDLGASTGLTPLPLPDGIPPDPYPMAPGSAACARALRGAGTDADAPLLLANPRALALGAALLRRAVAAFTASGCPLLATAAAPADHPCQFRRPMRIAATGIMAALGGASRPPAYDAANDWLGLCENGDTVSVQPPHGAASGGFAPRFEDSPRGALVVFDGGGPVPGSWLLELLDPATGRSELCARADGAGRTAPFHAGFAGNPGASGFLVWTLLRDAEGGAFDTALPFTPPGAPWETDSATGRIRRATGDPIRGRQDFPPVLAPDGVLFVLAPGLDPADDAAMAQAVTQPLVASAPAPALVRNALDLLRHTLPGEAQDNA